VALRQGCRHTYSKNGKREKTTKGLLEDYGLRLRARKLCRPKVLLKTDLKGGGIFLSDLNKKDILREGEAKKKGEGTHSFCVSTNSVRVLGCPSKAGTTLLPWHKDWLSAIKKGKAGQERERCDPKEAVRRGCWVHYITSRESARNL